MGRPRGFHPAVSGLESRALLSMMVASARRAPAVIATAAADDTATNQFLNPTGQPTAHEARRQQVRFTFDGKFLQSRGRFDDVASQVLIKGVGSSTYFLHGDVQLGAFVPTDATRETSGLAMSMDRNQSADSSFGFTLSGTTADLDRAGRPTRFSWTVNGDVSGGIFAGASGAGTVTIRYMPSGRSTPGVSSQGRALVLITGNVYTTGVTNVLGMPLSLNNTTRPRSVRL